MVRTWPDRIRAVTADAVQQAARTWLDRRHSVTGYLVKSLQPEEKPLVNAFVPARVAASPAAPCWRIAMPCCCLRQSAHPARATTIERVVSAGGIEAWLVHEPAVPLIAVDFAFAGGAAQDPAGKAGTANLAASLLDDGAGDLDSKAFSRSARAQSDRDEFQRRARQCPRLAAHADRKPRRGVRHLRLALTAPRFDAADVELNRAQILSMLRRAARPARAISPAGAGGRPRSQGHPYGRPVNGTLESLPNITHRRSQGLYRIACWRATISRSPSSATSMPKR